MEEAAGEWGLAGGNGVSEEMPRGETYLKKKKTNANQRECTPR